MSTTARRRSPSPPGKPLPGDLDPDDFDRLIEANGGYRVLWESATRCACFGAGQTEQPHPSCPECFGSGYAYYDEQEIVAHVQSLERNTDFLIAFGEWTFGKITVTVKGGDQPGHHDRYTLLDSIMQHTEIQQRSGSLQRLSYPVAEVRRTVMVDTPSGTVQRPNTDLSVLHLRLVGGATGLPSDLTEFADRLPGEILRLGEDFEVRAGKIDWSPGDARGRAPAEGARFAVTYYHHPRYVVTNFPNGIRDTRVNVPTNGVLVKTPKVFPVKVFASLDRRTRREED